MFMVCLLGVVHGIMVRGGANPPTILMWLNYEEEK